MANPTPKLTGASRVQAMVRIIFPIATPGILSAGIYSFFVEHYVAGLTGSVKG